MSCWYPFLFCSRKYQMLIDFKVILLDSDVMCIVMCDVMFADLLQDTIYGGIELHIETSCNVIHSS